MLGIWNRHDSGALFTRGFSLCLHHACGGASRDQLGRGPQLPRVTPGVLEPDCSPAAVIIGYFPFAPDHPASGPNGKKNGISFLVSPGSEFIRSSASQRKREFSKGYAFRSLNDPVSSATHPRSTRQDFVPISAGEPDRGHTANPAARSLDSARESILLALARYFNRLTKRRSVCEAHASVVPPNGATTAQQLTRSEKPAEDPSS